MEVALLAELGLVVEVALLAELALVVEVALLAEVTLVGGAGVKLLGHVGAGVLGSPSVVGGATAVGGARVEVYFLVTLSVSPLDAE